MMSEQTLKVAKYLHDKCDKTAPISDIVKTYKDCSKDKSNKRYLVDSSIKAIDFDQWEKRRADKSKEQQRKTADSLNFANGYAYLIEFKTGDIVSNDKKREDLIKGVLGKINNSDDTLFSLIYPFALEEKDFPKIRFYLVVDSKRMGINAYAIELARLSKGALDKKTQLLYDKVLPNLKDKVNLNHPDHFDKIDIWYSEQFDTYLKKHGISDIIFNVT